VSRERLSRNLPPRKSLRYSLFVTRYSLFVICYSCISIFYASAMLLSILSIGLLRFCSIISSCAVGMLMNASRSHALRGNGLHGRSAPKPEAILLPTPHYMARSAKGLVAWGKGLGYTWMETIQAHNSIFSRKERSHRADENFLGTRWGIISVGAFIGVFAPLLQKLGNPGEISHLSSISRFRSSLIWSLSCAAFSKANSLTAFFISVSSSSIAFSRSSTDLYSAEGSETVGTVT